MDKRILHTPIKIFALLIIFSFLLPAFRVGGFGMKLDLVLLFPLFIYLFVTKENLIKDSFFIKVFSVTFLVFISTIISGTVGLMYYEHSNSIYFPTEYISFLSKVLVMFSFFEIERRKVVSKELFLNSITFVFIASLSIGLLQILDISAINNLSELYATTENQVAKISEGVSRVYSTTGNVLTWAGWSGFILIFSMIVYKKGVLKWCVIILSVINLLFTSSRGALIAVIVSVLFYFIYVVYKTKKATLFLKYLFYTLISVFILGWISYYFFEERVLFFIDRFRYLNEAIFESGRGSQSDIILTFFNKDAANYIFGIGKPVVDSIGLMEIETLFILFAYGIVGLILQYLFIVLVIRKAMLPRLSVYSMVIIIGIVYFLIYSLGYFFIREIYSGLLFWAIIGYFLSKCLRENYEI